MIKLSKISLRKAQQEIFGLVIMNADMYINWCIKAKELSAFGNYYKTSKKLHYLHLEQLN